MILQRELFAASGEGKRGQGIPHFAFYLVEAS